MFLSGCGFFSGKSDTTALRNRVVNIAAQYKGRPYQYGATGPYSFDCSGFVSHVYRRAGISLPRTAESQFDTGEKVSKSDLLRGDLVFFTKGRFMKIFSSPRHVGIYIGKNTFIHASSSKGVCVNTLNQGYWEKRYKGARDVIKK
jgi:cell wall-associated NlpC family hydrolase